MISSWYLKKIIIQNFDSLFKTKKNKKQKKLLKNGKKSYKLNFYEIDFNHSIIISKIMILKTQKFYEISTKLNYN